MFDQAQVSVPFAVPVFGAFIVGEENIAFHADDDGALRRIRKYGNGFVEFAGPCIGLIGGTHIAGIAGHDGIVGPFRTRAGAARFYLGQPEWRIAVVDKRKAVFEDTGAFAHLAEVPFVVQELQERTTALCLHIAGSGEGEEKQKE